MLDRGHASTLRLRRTIRDRARPLRRQ
jgi:hypothetical protein